MVRVPMRFVVTTICFLGMLVVYMHRTNVSVAIVDMVKSSKDNDTTKGECDDGDDSSDNSTDEEGEFDWDETTQGIVLSAFFYGYIIPQLFGGRLAERLGPKIVVFTGLSISCLMSFLTPVMARAGVGWLIANRALTGFGQAIITPSMHTLIARWSPTNERSSLGSYVYTGNIVGIIITMPLAGYICDSAPDGGWPWVFYISGILMAAWLAIWFFFMHNSPDEHPWCSQEERDYIKGSIAKGISYDEKPPFPWKDVCKSLPLWATMFAHTTHNWNFYTLMTELPTYMKNVLGFDMKSNGLLSSVPYLCTWLIQITSAIAADKLVQYKLLSMTVVRKIFQCTALFIPALALSMISLFGCDSTGTYVMLVLCVGIDGGIAAGFQVNHVDLAPNFAGTLMGITNFFGTIPGVISPYITGVIINGSQTRHNWQITFYIATAILCFGGVFYAIFASGEEQPWNQIRKRNTSKGSNILQYGSINDPKSDGPVFTVSEQVEEGRRTPQPTRTPQL